MISEEADTNVRVTAKFKEEPYNKKKGAIGEDGEIIRKS